MASLTEVVASRLENEGAPSGAPSSGRKRGRPKGSKNKPKDADGNPIPPSDTSGREAGAPFIYVADPAGIAAVAKMFGAMWYIASPLLKVRPLNEIEQTKMGEALDPIMQKYVPMYNDWKYEINAIMLLVGLYQVCRKDWEDAHKDIDEEGNIKSKAEVVE